jgi:energy-coupling factor transporter ATP-binding protein EcfA2
MPEARLPSGKTLDSFDFEAVPVISKAQVMALATCDAWLTNGANLLLFGPPGGGKSHLAAVLGFALVENGWRVLFTRTTDLVQRLQIARRELALEAAIAKLDKYYLLILDDLAYVTKDQAETSVLFELIGARYERRSLLITASYPDCRATSKRVKTRLLPREAVGRRHRCDLLQRPVQPLMAPVLPRFAGDDALRPDAELDPHHRQPRQPPAPAVAKGGPLSERFACGKPCSRKAASKIGRTWSSSGRATASQRDK